MRFKYVCHHCDDLETESSICPVCGNRTELLLRQVYWSDEKNIPIIDPDYLIDDQVRKIGVDIRPVFPQERLMVEIIWGEPMKYAESSVWATSQNWYVIDGKRKKLDYSSYLQEHTINDLRNELKHYSEKNKKYIEMFMDSKWIRDFIETNAEHLNLITTEACEYIRDICAGRKLNEIFVSFSGGKDSTVTGDLVRRALQTNEVIHIYGDTTLEYPESAVYVSRFRKDHPSTPFLTAKNTEQDFLSMGEVIGPPSRVVRWCCTVFKTGAITKKIETTFKNRKQIISFQGIRRNESISRSKYDRESDSPKIAKQKAVSPIIDWFDYDIWLYILTNRIDFNDAYKKGFTRVGCWCCPNNSEWSEFLASLYMPEETDRLKSFLYDFAKKVGKEDWKEYVDSGAWKARQGGNGLNASNNTVVKYEPCALEDNTLNFQLNREISPALYELFKPFGKLDFSLGRKRLNEVYILDRKTNVPLMRLSGKIGSKILKITILQKHPAFKSTPIMNAMLRAQITKYQSCLACSGCVSNCKFDALKVRNMDKEHPSRESIVYTIDENKCVGCLNCVLHYDSGCLMYKVLKLSSKYSKEK